MRKAVRAIVVRGNQTLVMHRNKFGHEYYTLLGGGIDAGETAEQALHRELLEESGFVLQGARLVFVEEAGDPYGTQYIYLCHVSGDTPKLSAMSDEAKLFDLGNKHTPMWVPLDQFDTLEFRSPALQKAMLYGFEHGFPEQPVQLDTEFLDKVQTNIAKKGQA
jgi:ADP-ribose pyrophosphatase YjhB (NUDIX family)